MTSEGLSDKERAAETPRYLYGYGAKKHIASGVKKADDYRGDEEALCGAFGGFPRDEPERPVCKRCWKQWVNGRGFAASVPVVDLSGKRP